ncbi:MAG: hypothetical protein DRP58_06030 [Spirochaetes bacterium]|nr:MAG: hypothetical protein DRP58_06030 [Spirochaetota bacterium]
MKKNISIFIVLLLIISIFSIFGEETDPYEGKNYSNAGVDIYFRNGIITIDDYDTDDGELKRDEYKYTYHLVNKIPFLFLKDSNHPKYLALSSKDILLLYTNDGIRPLFGGFWSRIIYYVSSLDFIISTTSFYTDDKYDFPAKNLDSIDLFNPWIEGVLGYGVGEKVFFNSKDKEAIAGFYFSNGFVSFEKPYLYIQNSRVKKIKVTNENKDFSFVYDVEDTPNLQYFEVKRNTKDLTIEILDVYPGTKWEDTAINFILLDTRDFFEYSSSGDSDK